MQIYVHLNECAYSFVQFRFAYTLKSWRSIFREKKTKESSDRWYSPPERPDVNIIKPVVDGIRRHKQLRQPKLKEQP